MGSEVVTNKFLQVDRWGSPAEPGVVSLQKEKIDVSKLQPDEILLKTRYACIHPADIMLVQKTYPFAYNVANNILPSKFGAEGKRTFFK